VMVVRWSMVVLVRWSRCAWTVECCPGWTLGSWRSGRGERLVVDWVVSLRIKVKHAGEAGGGLVGCILNCVMAVQLRLVNNAITRDTARPYHSPITQIQCLCSCKNTRKTESTFILVALIPAVVWHNLCFSRPGKLYHSLSTPLLHPNLGSTAIQARVPPLPPNPCMPLPHLPGTLLPQAGEGRSVHRSQGPLAVPSP